MLKGNKISEFVLERVKQLKFNSDMIADTLLEPDAQEQYIRKELITLKEIAQELNEELFTN